MADTMTVKIEGLDVLDRRLKELGNKGAGKVLKKALRAAAKPVKKEAQARVAVDEGELKKAIFTSVTVTNKWGATARVGYKKHAFWGLFIEKGTSKMPARPFLRPALDTKGKEAVDIFADKLRVEIDKVTAVI